MKIFPTLYHLTASGKLQFWQIKVLRLCKSHCQNDEWGKIVICYGSLGTQSPQKTSDLILHGKNKGRSNETSAYKQAICESQAKWEKQKKRGYVESQQDALASKTDKIITGGVLPMLATNFDSQSHKIKYPCAAQPKLDGHRCLAIVNNGKVTLWTRTRKPYTSVPHIITALEKRLQSETIILDGELYNHDLQKQIWLNAGFEGKFEYIGHIVRQQKPHTDHKQIKFVVFDVITNDSQHKRLLQIEKLRSKFAGSLAIDFVESVTVQNEEDVPKLANLYIKKHGYEGIMLRNLDASYKSSRTRSYDLQKVKCFQDAEFKVVAVEEGRGKLAGHVGAFVCETKDGTQFKAKMKGRQSFLQKCFNHPLLWKGKRLTVQFQELTGKGVPRFPVALRFVN